jgi:glucose-6-phosphate 1-dehydrogenase
MDSFALVIFGITGNLAQIKLIPALYDLAKNDLLPQGFRLIGIGRSEMSPLQFEKYIHDVLHLENRHHKHDIHEDIYKKLCSKLEYLKGDVTDKNLYIDLYQKIEGMNKMFYLATFPDLYGTIFKHLKDMDSNSVRVTRNGAPHRRGPLVGGVGAVERQDPLKIAIRSPWTRLIIEKPLGTDLVSAKKLNKLLLRYFNEDQIFRLDHYLGKETMQNILSFRFGNEIFEPLVNAKYVDHVQITAAEDFGIGDRGRYYDTVGALKDVGQNHLLQMLALSLMDTPSSYTNEAVTKKRIEVLKNLVFFPDHTVFGQYDGYLKEKYIETKSDTDTFFAFKTEINSKRWKGVPIYVRGGKRLARTVAEISIVFKVPVSRIFKDMAVGNEPNILTYRIQPNEGIVLRILTKEPGHGIAMKPEYMQFCYSDPERLTDPYERLLVDALKGDQTFFIDAPEAEAQWKFSDKLTLSKRRIYPYKPGSWGPKEADEMIKKDGRNWIEPSIEFCKL